MDTHSEISSGVKPAKKRISIRRAFVSSSRASTSIPTNRLHSEPVSVHQTLRNRYPQYETPSKCVITPLLAQQKQWILSAVEMASLLRSRNSQLHSGHLNPKHRRAWRQRCFIYVKTL